MIFRNREDAGRKLAALLVQHRNEDPLVLALPRGGVPVAAEVARALDAPLDVLVVRKLGAPGQPELGVGAIAEGGAVFVDAEAVRALAIPPAELSEIAQRESAELTRRALLYREGRPLPPIAGRTVILVDDGIATGGSVRAAIRALRELGPRKLVVAAPVVSQSASREIRAEVHELVAVTCPQEFDAVGCWYDEFAQTTDEQVLSLLGRTATHEHPHPEPPAATEVVEIPCEAGVLEAVLGVPHAPRGLVIFAHGSGSGRRSHRNQHVAQALQSRGFATLLVDLLTAREDAAGDQGARKRFDVELLADRVIAATLWTASDARLRSLGIGYFGASTGAAAALVAATEFPHRLRAIVSRGGRPDLAGATNLVRVTVPTLLIVGGNDENVLQLNRDAMRWLSAEHKLVVVPGATHLFEEPGALDAVARLAGEWFEQHLAARATYAWPEGRPP